MKVALVFVALSLAVMVILIYQAAHQELKLRKLKTRLLENTVELKRKEKFAGELKTKFDDINSALLSVNTKLDEQRRKKKDRETIDQDINRSLDTCTKETADVEQKKSAMGEAIVKLKADHDAAKQNAGKDIQNLKEKILARDAAICALADTTKEEARKLCAIHEAQK